MVDVQDENISDEYNEYGNLISGIKTGKEEVDDSRHEHGCSRAVRKSPPPIKFLRNQVLLGNKGPCNKKTNRRITTDAEKIAKDTPVIELVGKPYAMSVEDARTIEENGN